LEAVQKPAGQAIRQLGEVQEEREDAENLLAYQWPNSWELKKSIKPTTEKGLL